ncbi:hypothetical protein BKA58DRAFT_163803 [Alternaria rosae]|uniref:uncharacterized protein n=1 Tax=Alternaria rosae TaxID=1187941 RepID=UPI001E8DA44F|nr:uncharacterized protein BKA58DRAFT_163803 [Alternaria rosae]KAH6873260.1 hypothetical protein BKA58DRAFT_163803 [Alternaria rosae]
MNLHSRTRGTGVLSRQRYLWRLAFVSTNSFITSLISLGLTGASSRSTFEADDTIVAWALAAWVASPAFLSVADGTRQSCQRRVCSRDHPRFRLFDHVTILDHRLQQLISQKDQLRDNRLQVESSAHCSQRELFATLLEASKLRFPMLYSGRPSVGRTQLALPPRRQAEHRFRQYGAVHLTVALPELL